MQPQSGKNPVASCGPVSGNSELHVVKDAAAEPCGHVWSRAVTWSRQAVQRRRFGQLDLIPLNTCVPAAALTGRLMSSALPLSGMLPSETHV